MKNSRKIIILTAVVLISSLAFCLGFAGIPRIGIVTTETEDESVSRTHCIPMEFSEETEITEKTETSATTERTAIEKENPTTKKTTTTKKETTTKKSNATKKTTASSTTVYTTQYNIKEMENRLFNEEWYFYDDSGEYKCKFFSDGTYEIYSENGSICRSGYYILDGNNLFLFNQCGNVISKMVYDPESKEFFAENYQRETTTAKPTTTQAEVALNDSNAVSLLWDAVECYDCFLNTTTYGLEYDYFGEYITCPHCGEQAFLVENFGSISDMYAYINRYLTGDAKETAEYYLEESIGYGMLTEYGGKLYVCWMYNEKGYCGFNYYSTRIVYEYQDGSYTVAVDDLDAEETYYLDVYFENGGYKIG